MAIGSGRNGLRRRNGQTVQPRPALNRPAIRRLARRAGVKRVSAGIYDEAPVALRAWLQMVIHDACAYTEHARRFTVTVNDILLGLKRNGVTLYGFDAMERRRRLTRRLPAAALAEAAQRVAAPACRAAPAGLAAPAVLDTPAVQPAPAIQPAPAVQPEPAAAAAQVAVSPERAMEIQASLASLLGKVEVNGAPVARILEWVDADLKKRARPECTPDELDVVLGALEARDAVMVTNADATSPRTVWFTY